MTQHNANDRQRRGVRRTVLLLAIAAVAVYGVFLMTGMR